ncbi:MAG: hypothetical protein KAY02_04665, partial [Acidovorax sp.]|nr:hypothetical protein [Acidovorax sp.]
NSGERQMFDAVCAACGKACKVPFQPRQSGKTAQSVGLPTHPRRAAGVRATYTQPAPHPGGRHRVSAICPLQGHHSQSNGMRSQGMRYLSRASLHELFGFALCGHSLHLVCRTDSGRLRIRPSPASTRRHA